MTGGMELCLNSLNKMSLSALKGLPASRAGWALPAMQPVFLPFEDQKKAKTRGAFYDKILPGILLLNTVIFSLETLLPTFPPFSGRLKR